MKDEKLDLLSEFTIKGLWWFPENPDQKFWGTLKYGPYDGAVLEMYGDIGNISKTQILILGTEINNRPISLYKCYGRAYYGSMSKSELRTNSYFISYVFINIHFTREEDVKFYDIVVHYSNLNDWVRTPILYNMRFSNYNYKIAYNIKSFPIDIDNGWKLIIDIQPEITGSALPFINFGQKAYIIFQPSGKKSFIDFLPFIRYFRNFLSLALIEPVYPLIIRGETEKDEAKRGLRQVEIIISDVFYRMRYTVEYKLYKMIFIFDDIKNNYQEIIKNWINKSINNKYCFDVFFSILYNQEMYLEQYFISMYQAIESYLWYKTGRKPDVKREFKKLLKSISLITDTINIDVDKFINKIIITRNYLIHRDYSKENKAIKTNEMYLYNGKLIILYIACLLLEAGFKLEDIKRLYDNSVTISRILESDMIKMG